MNDTDNTDSDSFNASYKILKETADWLARQEEPDIDRLVPKVERAMQAYQVCKERLEKVKTALKKYLPEEEASEGNDQDDDVPISDRQHSSGEVAAISASRESYPYQGSNRGSQSATGRPDSIQPHDSKRTTRRSGPTREKYSRPCMFLLPCRYTDHDSKRV